MSLDRLIDLPTLEHEVAKVIIEVAGRKSETEIMEFTLQELYEYVDRIDEVSEAEDIKSSIRSVIYSLRDDRNQVEDTVKGSGKFRLVEGELLFLHVRIEQLEQAIAAAYKILEVEATN